MGLFRNGPPPELQYDNSSGIYVHFFPFEFICILPLKLKQFVFNL